MYNTSYIYKIETGVNLPSDVAIGWLRLETNAFTGDLGSFMALPYRTMYVLFTIFKLYYVLDSEQLILGGRGEDVFHKIIDMGFTFEKKNC